MTNPKIEKVKADIARTKGRISECQTKLRELERQKTDLENLEIIALFRGENLSEDEFSALLHSVRKDEPDAAYAVTRAQEKEDDPDDFTQN